MENMGDIFNWSANKQGQFISNLRDTLGINVQQLILSKQKSTYSKLNVLEGVYKPAVDYQPDNPVKDAVQKYKTATVTKGGYNNNQYPTPGGMKTAGMGDAGYANYPNFKPPPSLTILSYTLIYFVLFYLELFIF